MFIVDNFFPDTTRYYTENWIIFVIRKHDCRRTEKTIIKNIIPDIRGRQTVLAVFGFSAAFLWRLL